MSFEIHTAQRSAIKPLMGFYGKSGGGKTLSALYAMRGMVGPKGRIVGIDTENKRMGIFADLVPGGFSVIDLDPPFSPERYWEAIQVAEGAADGIVIDSFSHEWAGEGGILDMQESELTRMAGDNWGKREACKMASWIRPKMEHKRLVERLLRLKQPLIVCMRGEEKTHISKNEHGKTEVSTDKFSSPIGDPRFIFEMLIHAEVYSVPNDAGHMIGGYLRITKITHHDVIGLLPKNGQQVSIGHGEALAKWCAGGSEPPKTTQQAPEWKRLKKELWDLTAQIHKGEPKALEQWLWDESIMTTGESLARLDTERLAFVIEESKVKLQEATR